MTKLIYHALRSKEDESPFDRAVMNIAKNSRIKISSPYIGMSYLNRLISVSIDWKLVTDVEAWLSSISCHERSRVCLFISGNIDRIHHYADLHAKTVIGKNLAYTGSANLTNAGILNRTEVGVLLDDVSLVNELHSWFDDIWGQTSSPKIEEVIEFSNFLNKRNVNILDKPQSKIESIGVKIKSRLINFREISNNKIHESTEFSNGNGELTVGVLVALRLQELKSEAFAFSEYVNLIRKDIPNAVVRDLYFEIVKYCFNLPRSVFAFSEARRFLFMNGKFYQGTTIQVKNALVNYDNFLAAYINFLSFHQPRNFPSGASITRLTGVGVADQRILIDSLVSRELIFALDNGCILNEGFEWPAEFNKFEKSKSYWIGKNREDTLDRNISVDEKNLIASRADLGENDQIYLKFSEFVNKNNGVVYVGDFSEFTSLISKYFSISIFESEFLINLVSKMDDSLYKIEFVSNPKSHFRIDLNLNAEIKNLPLTSSYIDNLIKSKVGFFYNYINKVDSKNKNNSYSLEDELEMISLYKNGVKIEDLVKIFGRSYKSVVSKLARRGVYKKS